MKKIILLLTITIYSCTNNFTEKEVIGTYVPVDYKQTFDTIILMKNGIYHRKVYDRNKTLMIDMKSQYKIQANGSILFYSYFLNLDRDLVKFPELIKDTLGGGSFILEKIDGKIGFCTGYASASLPNQNCYHKVD